MATSFSYTWVFTIQNATMTFAPNTGTIIPRANWKNVTSSDTNQSTLLNNALMSTNGTLTFIKTGTFVVNVTYMRKYFAFFD